MSDTVLIVSEDASVRLSIEAVLRSRGLPVRSAADGSEAYELLRSHDGVFAVLVVDFDAGVSGMNGWELLRRVRGRFEGPPLAVPPRVVVVSSIAEPATERFVRRLGAHDFLLKPVGSAEMTEAVVALIKGCRARHGPRVDAVFGRNTTVTKRIGSALW